MSFLKNLFTRLKHTSDSAYAQLQENPDPAFKTDTLEVSPNEAPQEEETAESGLDTVSAQDTPQIHPIAWQIAVCIENEFASPLLSAHGFAEALNMNSTYLCRIFRASFQMSISEYINRTRIHHSLDYLENTNMPIEEIARTVGFENTKYYFVLFKNFIGQTPRQYRISHQLS
ncbi:helix-turn-helix transcriptional regulator [Lachnospiraceae bacterium 62-35]